MTDSTWRMRYVVLVLAVILAVPGSALAQSREPEEPRGERPTVKPRADEPAYVPGQVIVKYRDSAGPAAQANVRRAEGLLKREELGLIGAEVAAVRGQTVAQAVRGLEARPEVEYAEPDFIMQLDGYADEPRFGELWGLHNTGQTVENSAGTPDIDINALEASTVTPGHPDLVVAVTDDGVDFSHPDLADRAWRNPGEVPNNNVDDDSNGFVDDVKGWDFHYNDKSVHDNAEDDHGTHVAGTIAASVNNQGVVGVAPNVEIMALKICGPRGCATSNAILAIQYAKNEGAKISNNSWGGGAFSQSLKDAIEASGSLFVASAGNGGADRVGDNNDITPHYPSAYDSPNILSVAAINNSGNLASFSNFGLQSVDIAAPGVNVLSSIPAVSSAPGATLTSVGSSGKALVAGFGAEEIGDAAGRTSFFVKGFTALDRGSQPVVLVDDDRSNVGRPNVAPTLSSAIQSATGTSPEVIEVTGTNGPALSALSGKTVVWATGSAFDSGTGSTTLTTTDQQTLTDFLNGGGKLVLTGMDALWDIEGSAFVVNTLKLAAASDLPDRTSFEGSAGTAFASESYNLNSSFSNPDFHDLLTPRASAVAVQGIYTYTTPSTWLYLNGTSMAAPHASGTAALLASASPHLLADPVALKDVLMDSGKPLASVAGKTVSGAMVDAQAALAVDNNIAPTVESVHPTGKKVSPRTDVTATFSEAMDPDTISAATFKLRQGTTRVAAKSVSYDPATRTATLDPKPRKLVSGATYTATVTTKVEDLAGNPLAEKEVWKFRIK